MRVLLVYPPITKPIGDVSTPIKCVFIGLAYLAAMLVKHKYEVSVLDCMGSLKNTGISDKWVRYGLTDIEIKEKIKEFKPDVVGITCMYTSYYRDALNIARIVKEYDNKILTILGGAHVSTFPDLIMKDTNVDCTVIGEGEYTLIDIVERFEKKQPFDYVKGILHRKNDVVIREDSREFIKDLDNLPFPAWHLLEYEAHKMVNENNTFLMRKPVGNILTSRGCPRNCSFCSVNLSWGTAWRARSAENVVDEIEYMVKTMGFREIHFVDDNMSTSKERIKAISQEIINRKIDIKWTNPTGIGYWTLSPDILDLMKESGCYRLTFGIESGSENTLKVIGRGKQHNWDKLQTTVDYANKIGLWTAATFIIGFPDETEEDFLKTLNKAKTLNLDFAVFYLLVPQPGTKIYSVYKAKKLLDFDPYIDPTYSGTDFSRLAVVYSNGFPTERFTLSELQDWLAKIYKSYFIYKVTSPKTYLNLVRKCRDIEDAIYIYGLAKVGIRMAYNAIFSKFSNQKIIDNKIELYNDDHS